MRSDLSRIIKIRPTFDLYLSIGVLKNEISSTYIHAEPECNLAQSIKTRITTLKHEGQWLIFKYSVPSLQETPRISAIKCREGFAVYCEKQTEPVNKFCGWNVDLLNIKADGAHNHHFKVFKGRLGSTSILLKLGHLFVYVCM
jgi:hypothetical protein